MPEEMWRAKYRLGPFDLRPPTTTSSPREISVAVPPTLAQATTIADKIASTLTLESDRILQVKGAFGAMLATPEVLEALATDGLIEMHRSLVDFATVTEPHTVPESLQMACIWALETFLAQDGRPDAKRFFVRQRLVQLLLRETVDRPCIAVHHMRQLIIATPQKQRSLLGPTYGEALARSQKNDLAAKDALSRAYQAQLQTPEHARDKGQMIRLCTLLSRVLRRLGENDRARTHEDYVVKHLKRSPTSMLDGALRQLFLSGGSTSIAQDHILQRLGGPGWLDDRQRSERGDRRVVQRTCGNCGKKDVKLSR